MRDKSDEILVALAELNAKHQQLADGLDDLREKMKTLTTLIAGKPGSSHSGLVVKVDRLEQEAQRRGRWVKAAVGASVTSVAGFIVEIIKTHLK